VGGEVTTTSGRGGGVGEVALGRGEGRR